MLLMCIHEELLRYKSSIMHPKGLTLTSDCGECWTVRQRLSPRPAGLSVSVSQHSEMPHRLRISEHHSEKEHEWTPRCLCSHTHTPVHTCRLGHSQIFTQSLYILIKNMQYKDSKKKMLLPSLTHCRRAHTQTQLSVHQLSQ